MSFSHHQNKIVNTILETFLKENPIYEHTQEKEKFVALEEIDDLLPEARRLGESNKLLSQAFMCAKETWMLYAWNELTELTKNVDETELLVYVTKVKELMEKVSQISEKLDGHFKQKYHFEEISLQAARIDRAFAKVKNYCQQTLKASERDSFSSWETNEKVQYVAMEAGRNSRSDSSSPSSPVSSHRPSSISSEEKEGLTAIVTSSCESPIHSLSKKSLSPGTTPLVTAISMELESNSRRRLSSHGEICQELIIQRSRSASLTQSAPIDSDGMTLGDESDNYEEWARSLGTNKPSSRARFSSFSGTSTGFQIENQRARSVSASADYRNQGKNDELNQWVKDHPDVEKSLAPSPVPSIRSSR